MSSLDEDMIKQLLEEDARQSRRGGSGRSKVDPTEDRSLTQWFKLNQHICTKDCGHRVDPNNPTTPITESSAEGITESSTSLISIGTACWNPNCVDPRNKESDRGANVVVEVKSQMICRYCYLDGYLL